MILTSEFFLNFPQFEAGTKKSFKSGTCVEPKTKLFQKTSCRTFSFE
ncbi:hypothetical protein LEP1GSC035_0299 [Leptospira noguchii str. 2007001578]|uniref:Uncharacterized protein n=1 Tax=Leptospira noguchii str. 2007001578 TaxID=1049974 RepID=A0ABN0J1H4_9LEPT|nr:hypothetical protein LEP1GSC035_0381 [Leptospira noguchii str. 2007001578]EMN01187.1 hypothetical protein LEP1GSC035_0299 [Leptospira noguchii str. 2007001578]